jgi:hypothetical protein
LAQISKLWLFILHIMNLSNRRNSESNVENDEIAFFEELK